MNVSLPSMLKLLQCIVKMNNTGVTGRIFRPILTLSMRAFGPRNSAYAFWPTTDTYIYIQVKKKSIAKIEDVGLNEDLKSTETRNGH